MISYMPLMRTLDCKGMSLTSLELSLGLSRSSLRQSMNKSRHLQIKTLLKIADILDCDIQDIIEWKEGEGVDNSSKFQHINWNKITEICKNQKISSRKLSLMIDREENFISNIKGRNGNLSPVDIEKVCNALNITKEDFVK